MKAVKALKTLTSQLLNNYLIGSLHGHICGYVYGCMCVGMPVCVCIHEACASARMCTRVSTYPARTSRKENPTEILSLSNQMEFHKY